MLVYENLREGDISDFTSLHESSCVFKFRYFPNSLLMIRKYASFFKVPIFQSWKSVPLLSILFLKLILCDIVHREWLNITVECIILIVSKNEEGRWIILMLPVWQLL
jgi:hypothetical protein